MLRASPGRGEGERGQATVELALLLPVLLTLVLVALQVGLVVRDQVLLVHSTREAARAAAVGAHQSPVPPAGGLDPSRLAIDVTAEGGYVRAVGTYRSPVVVPLVSAVQPDVTLRAELVMRSEEE